MSNSNNPMTSKPSPTVVVEHVSKTFAIKGLKKEQSNPDVAKVDALRDVTFVANRGESVGIIGQNGSGKSTLLRIMSGKDTPTSGRILVSSEPSLLGVAAAMQRHLTGLQNIELGCLAMGMHKSKLPATIEEIKEFCDIGDAIFRPLATYSSGMAARLKFAIATSVRPEILLVDEALSTGDASFNKRATDRMQSFLDGLGTIFVVSHSAQAIKDTCERGIWLHQGEPIADGPIDDVARQYNEWTRYKAKKENSKADSLIAECKEDFVRVSILDV